LLNIEREVKLSGPIHDRGVLILHSCLSALFGHIAPLALSASISFEQEYGGVEGDSASCAEHVSESLELLTGLTAGMADNVGVYPADSVLGRAQTTLQAFRLACQEAAGDRKPAHRPSL
jgi:hypothetical protein